MIRIKDIMSEDVPQFVKVISSYVNYNEDKGLYKIKNAIPTNLKSSGIGYHIISVPPKQITRLIKEGQAIPYPNKKPIISISKSTRGLAELKTNLENDDNWKLNNSLVLKIKYPYIDCIVDVIKFVEKFPDNISDTQYSNYIDEEEVIIINKLKIITPDIVDGYFINGVGKKFKK